MNPTWYNTLTLSHYLQIIIISTKNRDRKYLPWSHTVWIKTLQYILTCMHKTFFKKLEKTCAPVVSSQGLWLLSLIFLLLLHLHRWSPQLVSPRLSSPSIFLQDYHIHIQIHFKIKKRMVGWKTSYYRKSSISTYSTFGSFSLLAFSLCK